MSNDDTHSSTPRWIDDQADLVRFGDGLDRAPLAVDTEADSFHHYREKVCLIQISVGPQTVILDPLAGLDIDPLRSVLGDPAIRKVLHGADYDLRLFDRDFGVNIRGVFDTMIAARLVGERAYGLAALLEAHLGVKLDKRHQMADWSKRPLPDDMLRYAAADTSHLHELHSILHRRLEELDRTAWAAEEFVRLEGARWTVEPDDPEPYRRVKGASRLGRRELAILRELHGFRDRTARRRDVPVFRVMADAVLLSLAQHPPTRADDLRNMRGLSRRLARGGGAREILECVRAGQDVAASNLPEAQPHPPRRGPASPSERVKRLRARRDELADALGLEGSILASRATLEAMVTRLESGAEWTSLPDLRQWQIGLLAPLID